MTRCLSTVAVLSLLIVSSSRFAYAAGQSPFDRVRLGMTVAITDDTGKLTEGRVDSISDGVIRVAQRKVLEEVPLPRIVRIEKPDSLRNGALTGFIVGTSVGVFATIVSGAEGRDRLPIFLWATVGNGALYAAVGTGIDALIRGKRTLYERGREPEARLAPMIGPGVAGGMLRVAW